MKDERPTERSGGRKVQSEKTYPRFNVMPVEAKTIEVSFDRPGIWWICSHRGSPLRAGDARSVDSDDHRDMLPAHIGKSTEKR